MNYSVWTALKTVYLEELDYLDKYVSCIDANYLFTKRDSLMTIVNKTARLEEENWKGQIRVEIRHVEESDRKFWFTKDHYLPEKQFTQKVRYKNGHVLFV